MKYRFGILANGNPSDHIRWVEVLQKSEYLEYYDTIDITKDSWFEDINERVYDMFILRPPGRYELFKRLYDERCILIKDHFHLPVYPSITEILLYENKRYLRDWLSINGIPHPSTHVFFNKDEATEYLRTMNLFPVVGKTNIGASGKGVTVLHSYKEIEEYIDKAFSLGIKPNFGPKIAKGSIVKKIKKAFSNKEFLKRRIKEYKTSILDNQYHYVIIQEYIKHDYEWRCVRIGDSYFAHKKIVKNEKASGTLLKNYGAIPFELLDFVRNISEQHGLSSVAIDLFEKEGRFLINEIQCYFGQSDPYQMLVGGKPGRYFYKNGEWMFEEGMFNMNESYNLRLDHLISLLKV